MVSRSFLIILTGFFLAKEVRAQTDSLELNSAAVLTLQYKLEAVHISAPLLHRKLLTAPSSVSKVSGEDLRLKNGFAYIEQLEKIPGITAQAGTYSTVRVSIRGIGSRTPYGTNRIKAYLNNVPLTTGEGYSQIEDIDPAFLESIFVLKGAKSALYGNGLGGIMMLDIHNSSGEKHHLTAGVEYGSFNTLHPYILYSRKHNKWTAQAAYSFFSSDGWRENSRIDRHNLFTTLKHTGEHSNTNLIVYYIDNFAQIPSSINKKTFDKAPEKAALNWLVVGGYEDYKRLLTGLRHEHKIGSRWTVDIGLSLSFQNGYESRPFNILDDRSMHLTQKSLLSYKVKNFTLRGGYEWQAEIYDWQIYKTNLGMQGVIEGDFQEQRYPLSIFLQSELRLGTAILEGGISYNMLEYKLEDRYSDTLNQSGEYRFDPEISPFLGLNLPFGSNLRFYSSIGHGISYPDVEETLLPDYTINTSLKPETGINIEAGLRGRLLSETLFLDVALYRMHVKNLLITKRESEEIFYGKNAGKSVHQGLEFSLNYVLTKQSVQRQPRTTIYLSANLNNNYFSDFIDNGNDYTGNYLPGLPPLILNGGININFKHGLYFTLFGKWQQEQFMNDANTANYEAFGLCHVKAGYKLPLNSGSKIHFSFGVNNLLNTHYASMILVNAPSFGGAPPRYYYPGLPRNWHIGIIWKM